MKPGNKCIVCTHPAVDKINDFIRNKSIEIEGVAFTTATALLNYLNNKYPNHTIGSHNISRHKTGGHLGNLPKGRGLHVIYDNGKIYEPGATDEERQEITRFSAREALEIMLSIGTHAIMKGYVSVRAQDTIEAAKKLAELDKGAENANEWEQHMAEFLRKAQDNHIIEGKAVEALPEPDTQSYLDDVVVVSPESFVQGLKQPNYNPAEDILERPEDDENDRDYS